MVVHTPQIKTRKAYAGLQYCWGELSSSQPQRIYQASRYAYLELEVGMYAAVHQRLSNLGLNLKI